MRYGWEIADDVQRFAGNTADIQFVEVSKLKEAEARIAALESTTLRLKEEAIKLMEAVVALAESLPAALGIEENWGYVSSDGKLRWVPGMPTEINVHGCVRVKLIMRAGKWEVK